MGTRYGKIHTPEGRVLAAPGQQPGVWEVTATSPTDTIQTVTTPISEYAQEVTAVGLKYDAAVTKNATITRVSAAGALYGLLLNTIALSAAAAGTYFPAVPIPLLPGDYLSVVAEAGGSSRESSIVIVGRVL